MCPRSTGFCLLLDSGYLNILVFSSSSCMVCSVKAPAYPFPLLTSSLGPNIFLLSSLCSSSIFSTIPPSLYLPLPFLHLLSHLSSFSPSLLLPLFIPLSPIPPFSLSLIPSLPSSLPSLSPLPQGQECQDEIQAHLRAKHWYLQCSKCEFCANRVTVYSYNETILSLKTWSHVF